jgi:hypothetical protein
MAKTLIQLVNTVLPEIGFTQVTTVVGNSNQTAALALAMANREGRSLAKKDWRILIKRNVITTASSADSYSLPSDFARFIPQTEWNASTQDRMFGPVSDDYWQADLSGLTIVTIEDRWQLRADGNNNRIFIRPVPTSSENLSFFYAANSWCRSAGGQRQSSFAADDDVLLLDEFVFELGLKWRILQAQKRDFQTELAEYTLELKKSLARDGGMQTLRILGPVEEPDFVANVGDSGFGS